MITIFLASVIMYTYVQGAAQKEDLPVRFNNLDQLIKRTEETIEAGIQTVIKGINNDQERNKAINDYLLQIENATKEKFIKLAQGIQVKAQQDMFGKNDAEWYENPELADIIAHPDRIYDNLINDMRKKYIKASSICVIQ